MDKYLILNRFELKRNVWLLLSILSWTHTHAAVKEAFAVGLNNVLDTSEKPILLEFYSPGMYGVIHSLNGMVRPLIM